MRSPLPLHMAEMEFLIACEIKDGFYCKYNLKGQFIVPVSQFLNRVGGYGLDDEYGRVLLQEALEQKRIHRSAVELGSYETVISEAGLPETLYMHTLKGCMYIMHALKSAGHRKVTGLAFATLGGVLSGEPDTVLAAERYKDTVDAIRSETKGMGRMGPAMAEVFGAQKERVSELEKALKDKADEYDLKDKELQCRENDVLNSEEALESKRLILDRREKQMRDTRYRLMNKRFEKDHKKKRIEQERKKNVRARLIKKMRKVRVLREFSAEI